MWIRRFRLSDKDKIPVTVTVTQRSYLRSTVIKRRYRHCRIQHGPLTRLVDGIVRITSLTVRAGQARSRQDVLILHGDTGRLYKAAFAPDGRRLASLLRPSAFVIAADESVRLRNSGRHAAIAIG